MNSILECERCRVDRIEDVYLGNQEEMIHELLVDFDEIGGTEDYDIADELDFDLADIEDVKSRCIITTGLLKKFYSISRS